MSPARWAFLQAFVASAAASAVGLGLIGGSVAALIVRSPPARLETSTFDMTLPAGWTCDLEGQEYVCNKGKPPHPSIVIIAMKRRNLKDNMDAYERHLRGEDDDKTPPSGTPADERLLSLTRVRLAGYDWVDSLKLNSELEGFYTRYLATATSHVGVLVTLSAHKSRFEAENADLESMMRSLVIHQK